MTTPTSQCADGMDAGVELDAASDPDGGSDEDVGPEAVAKCEEFLITFCDRVVECDPTPPTHADCISNQRTVLDCGAVVCVTGAYDRCLSEVQEQTCMVWNASGDLPASCRGVLLLQ